MKHIPLSNSFLLASLIGLMISAFLTLNGLLDDTWAFLLNFMLIIFVIAAFVSSSPDADDVKLK